MKNWQVQLGFWGGIAWIGSFQAGDFLAKQGCMMASIIIFGYTMGFIAVFAGHIFWSRVVQGKWSELLGDGWLTRILSAIPLSVIFSYGIMGFCIGVFHSNHWSYSLAFAFGGLVVNQGLMPLIDSLDTPRRS
ncbi:hypothetical protein [Paracidovorax avenae]|uniref:hypothetical protein n=1 Tax=Paracidovorax avenae TaxID=80867 RepID=UPI0012602F52|nr:hypothetical protein [Paracidovorax avenae]